MKEELEIIKNNLLTELEKRVEDKILERSNANLLGKLIRNAESINEAISIAQLGTTYAEREFAEILKELAQDDNDEDKRVAMRVVVGKNNPRAGERLLDGSIEPQKLNPKKKYLWGKNFLSQSEIKFEYCLGNIHSSYPDFVMKDSYGRIHLFEVKSVNCSNVAHFDSDEYKDKMEELKRCYKQASILTGYNFYLPVLKDECWHISLLSGGIETTLTLNQFKNYVKANI